MFALEFISGEKSDFINFYKFLRSLYDQEFKEMERKEQERLASLAREEAEKKALKDQHTPGRLMISLKPSFQLRDLIRRVQSLLDHYSASFEFSPFQESDLQVRTYNTIYIKLYTHLLSLYNIFAL